MSEQREVPIIPEDLRESYADHLYGRVNYTLVRDLNYCGFERPVENIDELEATRTVAKELMVERATLEATTESMRFERDEARAASRRSLAQWHEARERIARAEAELAALQQAWASKVGDGTDKITPEEIVSLIEDYQDKLAEGRTERDRLLAQVQRKAAPLTDEEWLDLCAGDALQFADMQRHEIDALIAGRVNVGD